MTNTRVHRYLSVNELVVSVASKLLSELTALQAEKEIVSLCLTDGRTANLVYEKFAELAAAAELDAAALELWWASERFVPTTDPERNSTRSLSLLARTLALVPSQIHPMPPQTGKADPSEAAFAYAEELGDTVFDICMLGMGVDGHVASLFPGHIGFLENRASTVIGVTDTPGTQEGRVSLTLPTINRSEEVWFLVAGDEKAPALVKAIEGDKDTPAGCVQGKRKTEFFVDWPAASLLPYYACRL